MKIVRVDKTYLHPNHLKELKKLGKVVLYRDIPGEKEIIKRIKKAEIVIVNWGKMPKNVIASGRRLKMIAVAATGYDRVDIKEAKKRKIIVCNSPLYSTEAVAEHTIGLLLQAARLTFKAQEDIRKATWDPSKYTGKELKGKTLGIIGFGNIGRRVAEIAKKGLGMRITHTDAFSSRKGLEKLLEESDFISVNANLNEKTKNMLGEKEFGLMKNGVVIINTARGAIIDEQAFVKNLKSGKVFAAGLDVLAKEPMDKNNPLFSFPNVVITPHIAFNTQEALYNLSRIVVENIKKYLGGYPQNVVS